MGFISHALFFSLRKPFSQWKSLAKMASEGHSKTAVPDIKELVFRPSPNTFGLIQLCYIVLSFGKFSGNTSGTRTSMSSLRQKGQNRLATLFSSMMDSDLNVTSKGFAPGNEQL
jgi:hypothetical protein